jgi:hypothetical protein
LATICLTYLLFQASFLGLLLKKGQAKNTSDNNEFQ